MRHNLSLSFFAASRRLTVTHTQTFSANPSSDTHNIRVTVFFPFWLLFKASHITTIWLQTLEHIPCLLLLTSLQLKWLKAWKGSQRQTCLQFLLFLYFLSSFIIFREIKHSLCKSVSITFFKVGSVTYFKNNSETQNCQPCPWTFKNDLMSSFTAVINPDCLPYHIISLCIPEVL